MTQETFEQILKDKFITWNDMVEISIFNPSYNIFLLRPKTLTFVGALGYKKRDNHVSLKIKKDDCRCVDIYFEFNQIVCIEKIINYGKRNTY